MAVWKPVCYLITYSNLSKEVDTQVDIPWLESINDYKNEDVAFFLKEEIQRMKMQVTQ